MNKFVYKTEVLSYGSGKDRTIESLVIHNEDGTRCGIFLLLDTGRSQVKFLAGKELLRWSPEKTKEAKLRMAWRRNQHPRISATPSQTSGAFRFENGKVNPELVKTVKELGAKSHGVLKFVMEKSDAKPLQKAVKARDKVKREADDREASVFYETQNDVGMF